MPNYCVAPGCKNGAKLVENSKLKPEKNVSSFRLPNVEKKPQLKDLQEKWIKFVNRKDENGKIWEPGKESVLCEVHWPRRNVFPDCLVDRVTCSGRRCDGAEQAAAHDRTLFGIFVRRSTTTRAVDRSSRSLGHGHTLLVIFLLQAL